MQKIPWNTFLQIAFCKARRKTLNGRNNSQDGSVEITGTHQKKKLFNLSYRSFVTRSIIKDGILISIGSSDNWKQKCWGGEKRNNAPSLKVEGVGEVNPHRWLWKRFLLLSNGPSECRSGWWRVFMPVKPHSNGTKKLLPYWNSRRQVLLGSGHSSGATWLLPPALEMFSVSCGFINLFIFLAVDALQTVLISYLPSAGPCEESASLFCSLCLLWSRSSTPAIRRSCGGSWYASSREWPPWLQSYRTKSRLTCKHQPVREMSRSAAQSQPPAAKVQNTSVLCVMTWI